MKTQKNRPSGIDKNNRSKVDIVKDAITVYVFVLAVILPLYMPDGYNNIDNYKYRTWLAATLILLAILILYQVVSLIAKLASGSINRQGGTGCIIGNLNITDCFMLIYLLNGLISLVCSPYREYSLYGASGWWMGYLSQLLFGFMYLVFSRERFNRTLAVWLLGAASAAVCIIAVINRFGIDPFNVYGDVSAELRIYYLGTIGQATWYSSYLAVTFPLFWAMYVLWNELPAETDRKINEKPSPSELLMIVSRKRPAKAVLGVLIFINAASAVTQNSDSLFAAMAVMTVILMYVSLINARRIIGFLDSAIIVLAAFKVIGIIQLLIGEEGAFVKLGALSLFMSQSAFTWGALIILVLLRCLCAVDKFNKIVFSGKNLKIYRRCFLGILLAGLLLLAVIITVSLAGLADLPGYLHFDDSWGNNRGVIWRKSIESYSVLGAGRKLIGVGPGCMMYYISEFAPNILGGILTNAHNEFLTALIEQGLIGCIAYVGIFISAVFCGYRNREKNVFSWVLMVCVLSYMAHNFFCYQQVMCTPYVMAEIGLISYIYRNSKLKDGSLHQ